jgi:uncharacterized protein YaeQ
VAAQATIYRFLVALSDVDRQVYESLDLRVACHPSETLRYLLTRTLAYALSYEDGIAFSKGGLSQTEEPPIAVRDPTGVLRAWIDVGAPSADRLHKATKAADRVSIFTHSDLTLLRREAAARAIHKVETIEVWRIDQALLDAMEPKIDRHTSMDVMRNDGQLYVTIDGVTLDGAITRGTLVE